MKEYKPYKVQVIPYGEENINIAKDLQFICFCSAKKLKDVMIKHLKEYGYKIKCGNDYIYAKGEGDMEKIMLTAHIDVVHKKGRAERIFVNKYKGKTYLWSPQGIGGDDRCGVLAIKRIIESGLKPTILLCDKEETGGSGSREFNLKYKNKIDLNCIIELDRKGSNDLVFYEEDNDEWKKHIENITKWEEAVGSFSDICNLYDLGCASVNLSVGYYNQHTSDEYIVLEELENSIDTTIKIMKSIDKKWEHKAKVYHYSHYYDRYYDDYWWDTYKNNYNSDYMEEDEYEVTYINDDGELDSVSVLAKDNKSALQDAAWEYELAQDRIIKVEKVKEYNYGINKEYER